MAGEHEKELAEAKITVDYRILYQGLIGFLEMKELMTTLPRYMLVPMPAVAVMPVVRSTSFIIRIASSRAVV